MILKTLPTDMSATQKNEYRVSRKEVYRPNELSSKRSAPFQLLKNGSNETIPIVDFANSFKFDMSKAKMARIDGTITFTITMPHRGANGTYLPIKFGPDMSFECRLDVMSGNENWKSFSHFWGGSDSALSRWHIGQYISTDSVTSKVTTLTIAPTSENVGGKTVIKLTMPLNVLMTAYNANDPKFWLKGTLVFNNP